MRRHSSVVTVLSSRSQHITVKAVAEVAVSVVFTNAAASLVSLTAPKLVSPHDGDTDADTDGDRLGLTLGEALSGTATPSAARQSRRPQTNPPPPPTTPPATGTAFPCR
jgi:hypothetical protein